jgi:hypothetical protein
VYGGAASSDVLDDYKKFIVGYTSNTQPGSGGGGELNSDKLRKALHGQDCLNIQSDYGINHVQT